MTMNLGDRLEFRDLLVGDNSWRGDLARLLDPAQGDPALQRLAADLQPVLAWLQEIADEHLPLASPAEAVDYALTHASAFSISSIADYCGVSEHRDSDCLR
jgi:hypothetical protein